MEDLELWLESLPEIPVDEQWKARFSQQLRARQRIGKTVKGGLLLGLMLLLGLGGQFAYQKWRPKDGALPRRVVHAKLADPIELDGKSKEEILELRRQALRDLPELGPQWRPLEGLETRNTWQQIADGKRWTGLEGQLRATNENLATRFHEGVSQESFFILNPLVLIGLESAFVAQHNADEAALEGARRELVCDSVTLDGVHQMVELTYKVGKNSPFRNLLWENKQSHFLNLINAGEMGYNHFGIESSSGFDQLPEARVFTCNQFYQPFAVKHGTEVANQLFIRHVGFAPMRLSSVPAQLRLKLWRMRPQHLGDPADLTEVIHVVE